ncbi:MAG: dihydrodipicolinate synthase family protein [Planctomycetaceae bacterium]|jgi:4-hydroxy-tetrahydrodipicolinate synthase|nr:dihydrodipicolinate synthase family protein [Planctomycetaceae bacterium]
MNLHGIIPPLLTPLLDWQTLDVRGLENLVERHLSGGVHGLFLLGTCGEGPSLDTTLRREIIDRVTRLATKHIPVLVSVTDTSLKESLMLANYAAERGCSAVVLSAPYYYPITQDDLKKYLIRIATSLALPVFLYNIPSHTKIRFEIETLKEVFDHPQFIGLKDSSGDLDYFSNVTEFFRKRSDLRFLIGPEHLLISSMKLGGHGGICGGANLLPQLFVRIYDTVLTGNQKETEILEQRLLALETLYTLFPEGSFLANMKCALSVLGICSGEFAEPLQSLSTGRIPEIRKRLEQLGIDADTLE